MNVNIDLVPFTDCDPVAVGEELSDMVARNRSMLGPDFSAVPDAYATPEIAARTIEERQHQMRRNLGFEALLVVLSKQACEDGPASAPRISGVASHRRSMVPTRDDSPARRHGVHMAVWLDDHRPPELRRVGVPLLDARVRRIIANSAMYGRMWTLILPHNRRSARVWEHDGYNWGGFIPEGSPSIYPRRDNQNRRQLYLARFSLDQIRSASIAA